MTTVVKQCNCEHDFQDATYGKGNRVFNVSKHSSKHETREVCTSCGAGARSPSPSKQGFQSARVGRVITSYPVR
jgi:hypothetical protein